MAALMGKSIIFHGYVSHNQRGSFLHISGSFGDVPIFGATHFGHVIRILTVAVKERLEPEEMVFMAMTAWDGVFV